MAKQLTSLESNSDRKEKRDYPSMFFPIFTPEVGLTKNAAKWYRSTFYNMTILGLCNFSAPGIWGAMNSLGAGGAASPHLVNAANALTFCLMVLSCYFSSVLVKYIGIKGALIFGTYVYHAFQCTTRPGSNVTQCWVRTLRGWSLHKQSLWHGMAHPLWRSSLWYIGRCLLDG